MAVDMNAYFSILFTNTEFTSSPTSTVDYTPTGSDTPLTLTGVWDNATLTFSGKDKDNIAKDHAITVVIFFASG
jgi:hypothetical protein